MIPPQTSLVKYELPIMVMKSEEPEGEEEAGAAASRGAKCARMTPDPASLPGNLFVKDRAASPDGAGPSDQLSRDPVEEILDSILPPKEYEEEDRMYILAVSRDPATRSDVQNLIQLLDILLLQRSARTTGICPIRRELYDQSFDEMIRQVTINCAERGLLLLRLRDELHMTLATYESLYESSIVYGLRKALQEEQYREESTKTVDELVQLREELNTKVLELKYACEQTEKQATQKRQTLAKQHVEIMEFLRKSNQQLKDQLEMILSARK